MRADDLRGFGPVGTNGDPVADAIAVFNKAASNTSANAQTDAWLTLRAYIDLLRQQLAAALAERDRAVDLLSEVAECFTRDDDLPNELLPRIDAAIAAGGEEK